MPFRTGDIEELHDVYDWSDDGGSDRSGYGETPSEGQRVGTHASFEQLLERELEKDRAQNGRRGGATGAASAKPRKQFLKKGARGWWMENETAKQKMQKHVLESVVVEDKNNNQVGHMTKANRSVRKSPLKHGRRSPPASSAGTASPEPARRDDVAPVQISPVRLAPTTRTVDEGPRRSLPMWASANANVRTDASVETLTMSRVREDFESRREREADELADFEALEQELAAEKESYLREKHETRDDRNGTGTSEAYYGDDDDETSWLRDSADGASLQGESQHLLSGRPSFRSSRSNLDLGGESAMVFDADSVFQSPMPRASSVINSSQRPRHSFAPSEISAVSLNDSEPWGDANTINHYSNLPESPIPRTAMASALLRGKSTQDYGSNESNRRDSLSGRRGEPRRFDHQGRMEEASSFYEDFDDVDSTDRRHSAQTCHGEGAPVSALIHKVFGGAAQSEEVWADDGYQPLGQHSRNERGGNKKPNAPSSRPPRAALGQKASRQAIVREQRGEEDQLEQQSWRRAPGYSSAGGLPVAIEEKVAELEEQVKFYKSETLLMQRKKAQYDEEMQRLAREKENLGQYQNEQRQLIKQEWQQELQKMKHEKRMVERQLKLKLNAATSTGSRKDRAEIDTLKAQIVALQLEMKQSSGKAKATNDVLRQRIGELEGKNRELSEEIKFLERDRLDQWQKYEDLLKDVNARKLNKPDDRRDQLRTVDGISRVRRSAEELLNSPERSAAETTRSRATTPSESAASTPAYERGDEYNPGRYRQVDRGRVSSSSSSQSSGKHSQEVGDKDGRIDSTSRVDVEATVDEVVHPGGKRETTYRDGTKRIYFADGNEKEILPSGDVVIRFTNGDRKEYFPSTGVSVYHYHEAQTKLTTYPDKTKVYEFPNQQIEKSHPDGTTEIQFADGILKTIHPSGDEFSKFPDGTTMLETKDGLREVTLLTGKKVRYYPDGKMTLRNLDGQESEVRSDEELRELMEAA